MVSGQVIFGQTYDDEMKSFLLGGGISERGHHSVWVGLLQENEKEQVS